MGILKPGRPSSQEPPAKPGVYRWRNRKTGSIDKIGETNNLKRRKREYIYSGIFSPTTHNFEYKIADGRSTSRTRPNIEKIWINRHKPPHNKRGGGGGRYSR